MCINTIIPLNSKPATFSSILLDGIAYLVLYPISLTYTYWTDTISSRINLVLQQYESVNTLFLEFSVSSKLVFIKIRIKVNITIKYCEAFRLLRVLVKAKVN